MDILFSDSDATSVPVICYNSVAQSDNASPTSFFISHILHYTSHWIQFDVIDQLFVQLRHNVSIFNILHDVDVLTLPI